MSVRLAWHWAATTVSAAVTSTVLAVPFPSPAAGIVGAITATAICAIGYASAPSIRKDHSS